MGAANVIQRFAAWAAAAALLTAAPAVGQRLPPDTVKVEWARSSDGSLVILNAYAVRSGRPDPESVRGLIIESDPGTARGRYEDRGPDAGYAQVESAPFIRALGFSEVTLDTLANGEKGSDFKTVLSATEWARLLNRLLVEEGTEIADGEHRVIVGPVSPAVQSLLAEEIESLFKNKDQPNPVFPHLTSGRLALLAGPAGATRLDSIPFGSVSLRKTEQRRLYLKNYGARTVEADLHVSDGARDAGFGASARLPIEVQPGDSVPIEFDFTPQEAGSYTDTLAFQVDGVTAAQVVLLGEGKSPGIFTEVRQWLADWWWGVLGFLVLALVVVALVARMFGVRVAFPRFRKMLTAVKPGRRQTEPQPHSSGTRMTTPVVRTEGESLRRQLVTARVAIQEALAALGEDGASSSPNGGGTPGLAYGDLNAAENRRRLHELEREHERLLDVRSRLDGTVRALTSDKEALEGKVRALEIEEGRLKQQVSVLQGVRTENDELRRKQADADNAVAALRRQAEQAAGEQVKLGTRLKALAEVLELSDEMVSDAGWPETQRRLSGLRDGGKPRYLWNFEQMVGDLVAIFNEIASRAGEGRLGAAVSAVLGGSNNNGGLRTVAAALEREALVKRLNLAHARELRTLPAERFYREFVDRSFRPVIDNIAKLGSYARSRSRDIEMDELLSREGVDPALLERALTLIETRLAVDFGVEVQLPRLFEDRFDASRHETAPHSTLRLTLPDLEPSIGRLPPDTIYDITSVGLRSDALGVSVRPVVARVAAQ